MEEQKRQLTAKDCIQIVKSELNSKPSSHALYLRLVLMILNNPVVVFRGPLGGSNNLAQSAYINLHNVHAQAGCDLPTNKCGLL